MTEAEERGLPKSNHHIKNSKYVAVLTRLSDSHG